MLNKLAIMFMLLIYLPGTISAKEEEIQSSAAPNRINVQDKNIFSIKMTPYDFTGWLIRKATPKENSLSGYFLYKGNRTAICRKDISIPKDGRYYVWVHYCYDYESSMKHFNASRNVKDFYLCLNDEKFIINRDIGKIGWQLVPVLLEKGNLALELEKIGLDPYFDMLIITNDGKFVPTGVATKKINASPSSNKMPVLIPYTSSRPVIDGELTSGEWSKALKLDGFKKLGGNEAAPEDECTVIKLMYDEKNIYISSICYFNGDIYTESKERDDFCGDDSVEIFLDTKNSLKEYFHLIINSAGAVYDELRSTVNSANKSWNALCRVAVKKEKNKWTCELELPLSEIIELPEKTYEDKLVWKINFARNHVITGKDKFNVKKLYTLASVPAFELLNPNHFRDAEFSPFPKEIFIKLLANRVRNNINILKNELTNDNVNKKKIEELETQSNTLLKIEDWKEFCLKCSIIDKNINNSLNSTYIVYYGDNIFNSSYNLIPNPGFEFGTIDNSGYVLPANWQTVNSEKAAVCLTKDEKNNGKRSLLIKHSPDKSIIKALVKPCIDYTLPYSLKCKVKCANVTGNNYIEILWHGWDREKEGQTKIIGSSKGENIFGEYDWKEYGINAMPPVGTAMAEFVIHSENNTGSIYIDEMEFDGFGSEKTQICQNQRGYHPAGLKQVVIWEKGDKMLNAFSIIKADTGETVYKGGLKHGGTKWGRNFFYADFSDFQDEGKYILKIFTLDNKEALSCKFSVSKSLYLDALHDACKSFYFIRQGFDVPGWHRKDYLDDAAVYDAKTKTIIKHMDLSGGWRDAGDCSKQPQELLSIDALSEVYLKLMPSWKDYNEKYPDVLSDAWWATQRLVRKCHTGNGLFIGQSVLPNKYIGKGYGWWGKSPDQCTDNIPETADDRFTYAWTHVNGRDIMTYNADGEFGRIGSYTCGLLKFAYAMRKVDPTVSKEVYEVGKLNYQRRKEAYKSRGGDAKINLSDVDQQQLCDLNELIMSSIYLYKITQDKKYKEYAESKIDFLLDYFLKNKNLHEMLLNRKVASRWHRWLVNAYDQFMFLTGFLDYIKYCPEEVDRTDKLKKFLKNFCDSYIIPLTLYSPFNNVAGFDVPVINSRSKTEKKNGIKNFPTLQGMNSYLCFWSNILARTGIVLNEISYIHLAEKQVQWVLGRNPRGVCMQLGTGRKFAGSWTGLSFCKGHEDGVVPGAVIRGLGKSYYEDTPDDFPTMYIASDPGGVALPNVCEVYQCDTNQLILACLALFEAYSMMPQNLM